MTCTMFPWWMLMKILSLGRSSWCRGEQDDTPCHSGNMTSPAVSQPLHCAQHDEHRFHFFSPISVWVCLKSFMCSHWKVYHKWSPFVENEWVLNLPVIRAGWNKGARTHLYPLLGKPEEWATPGYQEEIQRRARIHFPQEPPSLLTTVFGFIPRQKHELVLCYCIK